MVHKLYLNKRGGSTRRKGKTSLGAVVPSGWQTTWAWPRVLVGRCWAVVRYRTRSGGSAPWDRPAMGPREQEGQRGLGLLPAWRSERWLSHLLNWGGLGTDTVQGVMTLGGVPSPGPLSGISWGEMDAGSRSSHFPPHRSFQERRLAPPLRLSSVGRALSRLSSNTTFSLFTTCRIVRSSSLFSTRRSLSLFGN